ncbi:MAG: hypothetical protein HC945_00315 [Nitrosarchaeum sp.]|nr:hypothetical protein [Nitrosarchaeum sp.]
MGISSWESEHHQDASLSKGVGAPAAARASVSSRGVAADMASFSSTGGEAELRAKGKETPFLAAPVAPRGVAREGDGRQILPGTGEDALVPARASHRFSWVDFAGGLIAGLIIGAVIARYLFS